MKKAAILVDAEWFRRMLLRALSLPVNAAPDTPNPIPNGITADIFYRNITAALDVRTEEIFRIFCYDCEPFAKSQRNPIDRSLVVFGPANVEYRERVKFSEELGRMPFVALRKGALRSRGWEIRDTKVKALLTAAAVPAAAGAASMATINPADIKFGLEQKGVDMRIGMDIATLSLKRIVERIILICGDTDLVPAIKLARREGVQVAVVQVGAIRLTDQLLEDSDLVRAITARA